MVPRHTLCGVACTTHYTGILVACTTHYNGMLVACTTHYTGILLACTTHYTGILVACTTHYTGTLVACITQRCSQGCSTINSVHLLINSLNESSFSSNIFQTLHCQSQIPVMCHVSHVTCHL